ncbi:MULTISPECIES: hypothetical protein [Streptomyces]|uniref:TetR family transcriptional regulator n=1 Tax=Streptomyces caniscabiei TaxID=2746961 RepID=A0ABU4N5G4_9ACTN|nr:MULTISPECIES: hypothetical protein [Streptomyces]MBE4741160.1 hypothetical protein [Streptomyces caniscabiei]MBE4760811.1 hypothetical protein [Streptomyces caniscabiei]MBE4789553.1 hypothetical protein [Streptomyces caniscabiei]MBE4798778.1 hypothetical protein [Streptomyces caniscabiei]MDX2947314.1 hypothetical protein [Streptomyces caniscabiei]
MESLIMGYGLFGTHALVGERRGSNSAEQEAAIRRRLDRMIQACLDD